ncbi:MULTISPECIES: glycosyltransferase [Acinetobacter calcoaceticus/baumannii complex]|uniref:glycosyltransferase n=1 Tax=Acinetobacter calcoaceticus/baumannii complex TaxID=909768 RepID=UPI001AE65A51|nr:glycosyltransferase [Acinetobacter baumannii]MBP1462264.1 glycosyltransferase [Acinetobacter nosocomialis]MDC4739359.1 glycosyltransferase [Acinetobacter baumannii]MDI9706228.1 glycosyltransferase [Acinetobacter baumannii]HDK8954452.1 glycosyltransferase [Acinetobacter baumannii]HDR2203534.1 glycosyltransferase [Acinetobacter baumannii]
MKILYVITGLGGGGAEKVVADLADQMTNKGHQVKIAYLKGNVIVRPKNDSIELIYIGLENLKSFKISCKRYKEIIKKYQPDIVHSHMVHANIFTRIMRYFCKIPKLVCTAHNSNEGGSLRMLAYRYTNNLSDINTNVSKEATESFQEKKAFDSTAITIYNGIDLNKFRKKVVDKNVILSNQINLNQKIILAVGRLNEQKDYPNLLKAISLLKENSSEDFKLLIAGDGEQKKAIEELISKLNLDNDVILLGRRNDIAELMSIADYFVLSSAFEGFGLVVAEAMACETFVVATDCGGVKEVMGGYGLMASPKDSKGLADQLRKAINMPLNARLENNRKALNYVHENFDLEKTTLQWLRIYES